MGLPTLALWQEAALPPSEARTAGRPARRRPERPAALREREARRARELARRARYTAARGLFLSVLFAAPLGWSFVESTVLAAEPTVDDACPTLTSFLSPELQGDLEAGRASGAMSPQERRMMGLRVCDPAVRFVVEPFLKGVADLGELQELAHAHGALPAGADPLSALPALLRAP